MTVKNLLEKLCLYCEPIIYIINEDWEVVNQFTTRLPDGTHNDNYRQECIALHGDDKVCDGGIEIDVNGYDEICLTIRVKRVDK